MVKGKRNYYNSNNLGYKKLILYQKAKELVLLVYKLTAKYPKSELFNLVTQMRRASVSVLANIVEGYSKESSNEYARFLTIAIGSITELEVLLDLSQDLKFITREDQKNVYNLLQDTKNLLYGSRKAVRLKAKK